MSGARSSIYYRPLIRDSVGDPGNGEDIANINTAPLPDGCECYVTENRSTYRLAKFSTRTPSGATVIAPIAGGGRWFLVSSPSSEVQAFLYSTLGMQNTFAQSGDWVQATTAEFAATVGAAWTFGASGALLTYNGPAVRALATLTAVLSRSSSPASIYMGISVNLDLAGALAGTQGGPTGAIFVQEPVGDVAIQAASQRLIDLAPGDVIQPRFGIPAGDPDSGVIYTLQLSVQAA